MKTKIEISDFGYGYEDKNEDKNLNSKLAGKYLLGPKRSEKKICSLEFHQTLATKSPEVAKKNR